MSEELLNSASAAPSSTVALSMSETVPAVDERHIIVESMADSSESSCTEENSSPARFEFYFKSYLLSNESYTLGGRGNSYVPKQ